MCYRVVVVERNVEKMNRKVTSPPSRGGVAFVFVSQGENMVFGPFGPYKKSCVTWLYLNFSTYQPPLTFVTPTLTMPLSGTIYLHINLLYVN